MMCITAVHSQTYGWLDWAKNGETSGTIGFRQTSGIGKNCVLVAKGGQAPGATTMPKKVQDSIVYKSHVQTYGWQDWVSNGALSGTTGLSKRSRIPPNWGTEAKQRVAFPSKPMYREPVGQTGTIRILDLWEPWDSPND